METQIYNYCETFNYNLETILQPNQNGNNDKKNIRSKKINSSFKKVLDTAKLGNHISLITVHRNIPIPSFTQSTTHSLVVENKYSQAVFLQF